MKLIVFALVLMVALGFRHAHKSQYDLGYEAGMQDAMEVSEMTSRPRKIVVMICFGLKCDAIFALEVQYVT